MMTLDNLARLLDWVAAGDPYRDITIKVGATDNAGNLYARITTTDDEDYFTGHGTTGHIGWTATADQAEDAVELDRYPSWAAHLAVIDIAAGRVLEAYAAAVCEEVRQDG